MANFDLAYINVKENEGGFNRRLGDGQGWTYAGLTEVSDPDFFRSLVPGTSFTVKQFITQKITQNPNTKEETKWVELQAPVKDYYKKKYWVMAKGDLLTNQHVANMVFSFFVASGYAGRNINIAINKSFGKDVVNVVNSLTIDGIKYLNEHAAFIYPVLYQQRLSYMKSLKTWVKYGAGWLRMMAMFPLSIVDEKKK